MKYVPRFINKSLESFPNSQFVNKIRCFYYNVFEKPYFRISFDNGHYKVDFKNGLTLKFVGNPYRDLLQPLPGYLKHYKIKEKDCIIDAGAYIGAFAVTAAKMVNKGRVIAFEPDKSNFEKLVENIKLNHINNVTAINKGLWNKNEILKFDNREDKGSMIVECMNGNKAKGKVMNYEFATLDDELKKMDINRVDFIKADVEGAELEVIEGCKKTLKNNEVNLAIASYHIRGGEKTCKKLEIFFNNIGYNSSTGFEKHLTTYAHKA